MTRSIIIDCDPGIDDCIALLMALGSPKDLVIKAICTVAGNVPVQTCSTNACQMLTLSGQLEIPVYQGCPRPMVGDPVFADHVHGKSGLGSVQLPHPGCKPQDQHAVAYLIEALKAADAASVTLVIIGPMTNVALALIQEPAIAHAIDELVIMGGARREGGNMTASAEFNIYADPHAAKVVLGCGRPITLIGLDTTLQYRATPERMDILKNAGHRATSLTNGMLRYVNEVYGELYGTEGAAIHDPCTIGYLLAPELFQTRPAHVEVSVEPGLTRGHTAVDVYLSRGKLGNVNWATAIDADAMFDLMLERMTRL